MSLTSYTKLTLIQTFTPNTERNLNPFPKNPFILISHCHQNQRSKQWNDVKQWRKKEELEEEFGEEKKKKKKRIFFPFF